MHPFCLPLQKSSFAEIIQEIEQTILEYPGTYQYFEVWIDLIEGTVRQQLKDDLIALATRYPGQLIYLFRRPELAPIKMALNERLSLLRTFTDLDVLIDLDIGQQQPELDFVRKEGLNLNLITSYHNYQETPSLQELINLVEQMEPYNPKIYKLACFCNSEYDCLSLLKLILKLKEDGKTPLVLGMGAKGQGTRLLGPLWGNALSFAPKDQAGASAPGQLGVEALRFFSR